MNFCLFVYDGEGEMKSCETIFSGQFASVPEKVAGIKFLPRGPSTALIIFFMYVELEYIQPRAGSLFSLGATRF